MGSPELKKEKKLLSKVFLENNAALRQDLFKDPLIKHLWSKIFITEGHSIITDYIRFVRTKKSDGDIHADRII